MAMKLLAIGAVVAAQLLVADAACAQGKWKYGRTNRCYNCPAGRIGTKAGLTTSNQCTTCPRGKYTQYSGRTSISQCSACPSGRTTSTSSYYGYHNSKGDCRYSTAMHAGKCPAGKYKRSNTCFNCPAGRYTQYSGRTSYAQCSTCPAGRYNQYYGRTRSSQCRYCPAGRYTQYTARTTYRQCYGCPAGKYTQYRGRTRVSQCTACPRGRYTQYYGRTSSRQCYACPRGKTTAVADGNGGQRNQKTDCRQTIGHGACMDNNRALQKLVRGTSCYKAKTLGLCQTETQMAQKYCPVTCQICPSVCHDKSKQCREYAAQCNTHSMVKQMCCATCKRMHPPMGFLVSNGYDGCKPTRQCTNCVGDCDKDADCQKGLKCFQRNGNQRVPGCLKGGIGDMMAHDYCYRPRGH